MKQAITGTAKASTVETEEERIRREKQNAEHEDELKRIPLQTANVRRFKSMEVALKTLEPYVKNGRHLQTGKPFRNFGDMRSREALANWLLCAAVSAIDGRRLSFTTTTDLIGGDGIIVDENSGDAFPTEHVMVPSQATEQDAQALILKAIEHKRRKGGSAYASGKTLVVFLNAGAGEWFPNRIVRVLPSPLHFDAAWAISLQRVEEDGTYVYAVTQLEAADGNAPAFSVRIAPNFDAWKVEMLQ